MSGSVRSTSGAVHSSATGPHGTALPVAPTPGRLPSWPVALASDELPEQGRDIRTEGPNGPCAQGDADVGSTRGSRRGPRGSAHEGTTTVRPGDRGAGGPAPCRGPGARGPSGERRVVGGR